MPRIPEEVTEALRSHKVVQAQLIGTSGLAWVLTGKKLFIWDYQNDHDNQKAAVHSHSLPYALPEEPCHVFAVQHQVESPSMPTTVMLPSAHQHIGVSGSRGVLLALLKEYQRCWHALVLLMLVQTG